MRFAVGFCFSMEQIAEFLCRDAEEVRAKIAELDRKYPGLMRGTRSD